MFKMHGVAWIRGQNLQYEILLLYSYIKWSFSYETVVHNTASFRINACEIAFIDSFLPPTVHNCKLSNVVKSYVDHYQCRHVKTP